MRCRSKLTPQLFGLLAQVARLRLHSLGLLLKVGGLARQPRGTLLRGGLP